MKGKKLPTARHAQCPPIISEGMDFQVLLNASREFVSSFADSFGAPHERKLAATKHLPTPWDIQLTWALRTGAAAFLAMLYALFDSTHTGYPWDWSTAEGRNGVLVLLPCACLSIFTSLVLSPNLSFSSGSSDSIRGIVAQSRNRNHSHYSSPLRLHHWCIACDWCGATHSRIWSISRSSRCSRWALLRTIFGCIVVLHF